MERRITLGSLFDGIGGFPLCAEISGIKPVWAAEVLAASIAVTKQHFPDMLHLGDVSKISGAEIPPVDIITFGSPCQDVSVAGKRKGIKHKDKGDEETTRSGLFFEAIRIIYEMREATNGRYPTFIVWENVPGACEGCIKKCYAVCCPKTEGGCGATSGWNKTKEEAKNAWNCREGQSDEI